MTAFPTMQASLREEETIPQLAVEAFRQAFTHALETSGVVYAKGQQLVQQLPNGEVQVLKDISSDYVTVQPQGTPLRRKKRTAI